MPSTLQHLRATAMHAALLTCPGSLKDVIDELGFIQYDPIRRPARAQDLILPSHGEHEVAEPERHRRLTMRIARILAPIREGTLRSTLAQLARHGGVRIDHDRVVAQLLTSGQLEAGEVEGVRYLWPPEFSARRTDDVPQRVRFLAPFAVGWVNCEVVNGTLNVTRYFAARPLHGRRFEASFDREVTRMARMLGSNVVPRLANPED